MFVVFIELKILGSWTKSQQHNLNLTGNFLVSTGNGSDVEIIAPDGLRRHLSFERDATISIGQNILSYNPDAVEEEITVDEQEQSGKGKARDTLR